ncbi:MAG: carbohydrate kinase family protein [Patescibacteria group bacterium]
MTTAKSRNAQVLTIGAATRDVFIQSPRFKMERDADAPDGFETCFPLGAKIDIDKIIFETGGGATNAAVTFVRFGLKTATVARIGNDLGGRELRERLVTHGIDVSSLQEDKTEGTGYSLILVSGTGQRAILVYRGASRHIDAKKINWNAIDPSWVYLTSVAGDKTILKDIFAQTRKRKVNVAWNPGNAELEIGLKALMPWIAETDILILNREEAAELADTAPRHLDGIFHRLSPLPRQALVVTDGAHGAYVHARGTTWYAPALHGKRINTTGAGDAFGSAFTAMAIKSGNLETGLRAGMLNSLGVITHMGAKSGILKKIPSNADLARVKVKTLPMS